MIDSIWTHWHGHPDALIGLAVLEGAYLLGVGPLRERFGLADEVEPRKVATFTLGVLVVVVAILSPLHVLSDVYLFSAHMVQHILLTLVAPPLLILGTPDWLLRPFLRTTVAFRIARVLTHPVVAFAAFTLVFSLWHVPGLYNLSVTYHGVHIGEHILFMATAAMMWWPLTSPMAELPRVSYPIAIMYLFLLSIGQIVVFGSITFAPEPLYEWYVSAPRIWGITPLADQQIGAVIMKMGGGAIFLLLIVVLFFRWYQREERDNILRRPGRSDAGGVAREKVPA